MLLERKISDAGIMFFKECFRGLSCLIFSLMTLVQKICAKNKVVGVRADKTEAFMQKYLTAG